MPGQEAKQAMSIYDDPRHYDFLLGDHMEDLDFYRARAQGAKGSILELACGTGRLTLPLAAGGLEVTGLDLSEAMLERAREKAKVSAVNAAFVQGDIRDFHLSKKFELVFLPYNSMQHLHRRGELESLFSCVREHLADSGRFILDVHHPDLGLLKRQPGEIFSLGREVKSSDGFIVSGEEVNYDEASQIYSIRWHYAKPATGEARSDELKLRMFFPQELDALLAYNGLELREKYGNFEGKPFATGDAKQVAVCGLS
jgi:SAM-dependent methyltransferase